MASTYLSKTYGSAGNRKTMTFSFWIKRSNLSTNQYPMSIFDGGTGFQADMRFAATTDVFRMYSTDTSGTPVLHLITDRVFRDVSAWYHIVWEIDTTQATASDRVKLYVNGVQETSFSTETYPAQNTDLRWNGTSGSTGGVTQIGAINGGNFIDGYMAHFHFIDGTAYDASTFGETDATTGIWKPKTAPSVTYGTNGFFLKFENSGAMGTDSSGNANNFTVNGTMTQTIDTPSNVFATWNRLIKSPITLSAGNLQMGGGTLNWDSTVTTIVPQKGKWYAEIKVTSLVYDNIGFVTIDSFTDGTGRMYEKSNNITWLNNVSTIRNYQGASSTTAAVTGGSNSGFSRTSGDIVMLAFDMENGYGWFGKNGTWLNSGDPASGTNAFILSSDYANGTAIYAGYYSAVIQANFGNGYFGTTAVSSPENPDDGIGIFEYAVPTGYKALCTKSINAQEYD